ncbi:serine/threonine-protein kinase PLK4-like [Ptychodera flava]|uniref:serine/threonine-protein kinase PLK4-like n=1 Tax=Ptychodera flava TaxID=63121 RepID=UPI003969D4F3
MSASTVMGDSIEDFQVLNLIGKGGFACVYRARSLKTGLEVAIKMIDKKRMHAAGMVSRVRNEVEIHCQLKHPSILELYGCFEDDNYVYLVLEMCHNGELNRYLRTNNKVISEEKARIFLKQIVLGLLYLHSHGILHRDLTLANILLTSNMDTKIADFGLAARLSMPTDKHYTMCGTPNYISPEIATRSAHGLESDVWSLGCMLYTFLVGKPPFDTDAVRTTLNKVVLAQYEMPKQISKEAKDLISRMLRRNPSDRITISGVLDHPFMTGSETIRHTLTSRLNKSSRKMRATDTSLDSGNATMAMLTLGDNNSHQPTQNSVLRVGMSTPQLPLSCNTVHRECDTSCQDQSASENNSSIYQNQQNTLKKTILTERNNSNDSCKENSSVCIGVDHIHNNCLLHTINKQSAATDSKCLSHVSIHQTNRGEECVLPRKYDEDAVHKDNELSSVRLRNGDKYGQTRVSSDDAIYSHAVNRVKGHSSRQTVKHMAREQQTTAPKETRQECADINRTPVSTCISKSEAKHKEKCNSQGLRSDVLTRLQELTPTLNEDKGHSSVTLNNKFEEDLGKKCGKFSAENISPIKVDRLRPIRQRTRNAVVSILKNGEVCLEFLKSKENEDRVVEVLMISDSGTKITVYHPNKGKGLPVLDIPPQTSASAKAFSLQSLPGKYLKKYQYAVKFVQLVKTKTAKVTLYSDEAKCILMENAPQADFEASFYNGGKVTKTPASVTVIEQGGKSHNYVSLSQSGHNMPSEIRSMLEHANICHQTCLDLESAMESLERQIGHGPFFPIVVRRRPTANVEIKTKEDDQKMEPKITSEEAKQTKYTHANERVTVTSPSLFTPHVSPTSLLSFNGTVYSTCMRSELNPGGQAADSKLNVRSHLDKSHPLSINNIVKSIFVPDVGWASQLSSGEVWVKFNDGSQLMVQVSNMTVKFIDSNGNAFQYTHQDKIPECVKRKLSKLTTIVEMFVSVPVT